MFFKNLVGVWRGGHLNILMGLEEKNDINHGRSGYFHKATPSNPICQKNHALKIVPHDKA